eukprot:6737456-Alexandrium_andersonii.AAC.1
MPAVNIDRILNGHAGFFGRQLKQLLDQLPVQLEEGTPWLPRALAVHSRNWLAQGHETMDAREDHVRAMMELEGPALLQRQGCEPALNNGLNRQQSESKNFAVGSLVLDELHDVSLQRLAPKLGQAPASLPNTRSREVCLITSPHDLVELGLQRCESAVAVPLASGLAGEVANNPDRHRC